MAYKSIFKQIKKLLKVFNKKNRLVQLRFNSQKTQEKMYIACLYYTILELAEEVLILLESNKVTALPIIVRSLYEGMIELRCFIKNENYLRQVIKYNNKKDLK